MRDNIGRKDKEVLDANIRFACDLHAHNLLLFRTLTLREMSLDRAMTIVCSTVYLQTRHTWNRRLLMVPETEVFEVLQA